MKLWKITLTFLAVATLWMSQAFAQTDTPETHIYDHDRSNVKQTILPIFSENILSKKFIFEKSGEVILTDFIKNLDEILKTNSIRYNLKNDHATISHDEANQKIIVTPDTPIGNYKLNLEVCTEWQYQVGDIYLPPMPYYGWN